MYKRQGLDRAPAWENGYISGGTSDYSGPPTVFFYVQEEDYRPVELRLYRGDGLLISSYNSVAPDSSSVYDLSLIHIWWAKMGVPSQPHRW